MGYYVRVFCKNGAQPPVARLKAWLATVGSPAVIEPVNSSDGSWTQLDITYKSGRNPILVEWNGGEEDLLRDEIQEFLEAVGEPGRSKGKKLVRDHLAATRAIVASQLPTSDIDDDGYEANYQFLRFFVEESEGLIHADGEGFYSGDKIIVRE